MWPALVHVVLGEWHRVSHPFVIHTLNHPLNLWHQHEILLDCSPRFSCGAAALATPSLVARTLGAYRSALPRAVAAGAGDLEHVEGATIWEVLEGRAAERPGAPAVLAPFACGGGADVGPPARRRRASSGATPSPRRASRGGPQLSSRPRTVRRSYGRGAPKLISARRKTMSKTCKISVPSRSWKGPRQFLCEWSSSEDLLVHTTPNRIRVEAFL